MDAVLSFGPPALHCHGRMPLVNCQRISKASPGLNVGPVSLIHIHDSCRQPDRRLRCHLITINMPMTCNCLQRSIYAHQTVWLVCLLAPMRWSAGTWSLENYLLLYPNKTKAVITGSRQQIVKFDQSSDDALVSSNVLFVDKLRVLDETHDSQLTFDDHISGVVRHSCHQRDDQRHVIVGSRLVNCNSVLYGITAHNINRLQRVQNSLARTVWRALYRSSAIQLRRSLHWLPIDAKLLLKCESWHTRFGNTTSRPILSSMIINNIPLRSAGTDLVIARTKTVTASLTFGAAAPRSGTSSNLWSAHSTLSPVFGVCSRWGTTDFRWFFLVVFDSLSEHSIAVVGQLNYDWLRFCESTRIDKIVWFAEQEGYWCGRDDIWRISTEEHVKTVWACSSSRNILSVKTVFQCEN